MLTSGNTVIRHGHYLVTNLRCRTLEVDAQPQVTASWVGDGSVDGGSGGETATLRLRSDASRVSLTVDVTDVRATGYPVRALAPEPVVMEPGGIVDVAIPLEWQPPPEEGTRRRNVILVADLTVAAEVGTPWSDALETLRIPVQPAVTAPPPLRLTSEESQGWSGAARTVALVAALLVLAVLAAGLWLGALAWRRRNPAPAGVLHARPLPGRVVEAVSDPPVRVQDPGRDGRRAAGGVDPGPRAAPGPGRAVGAGVPHPLHAEPRCREERPHPDWSYCRAGGSVLVNGMLFVHHTDLSWTPTDGVVTPQ